MNNIRREMHQAMFNAVKEIVGDGYVFDYYKEFTLDFVEIAEWYAREYHRITKEVSEND